MLVNLPYGPYIYFCYVSFGVFFGGEAPLSKRPSVFFLPRWTNDVSSEAHVETMKQMRRENTRKLVLVSNIVSFSLLFGEDFLFEEHIFQMGWYLPSFFIKINEM